MLASLVAGALLSSCDPQAEELYRRSETGWRVEYAGCPGSGVADDSDQDAVATCQLAESGALTLWVPATEEAFVIQVDGRELDSARIDRTEIVDGGTRIELSLPTESQHLVVRRLADDAHWRLAFETEAPSNWQAEVYSAMRARRLAEATEQLERHLPSLVDADRGHALALLGQLAFRQGETARGQNLLREALPLLASGDDRRREADQTMNLVYSLIALDHRFTEARTLLDELAARWSQSATQGSGSAQAPNQIRVEWQPSGEVAYFDSYYRGILAAATGDARGALGHLDRAVTLANHTGSPGFRRIAEEMRAVQLQKIGRRDEAAAVLDNLLQQAIEADDPCRQAGLLNNLGWNGLLALEAGQGLDVDPASYLREARSLLEAHCPEDVPERRNTLLNLALAALHSDDDGSLDRARDALAQSDGLAARHGAGRPDLRFQLWRQEIAGRLALAENRPRLALALYESLGRLADAALVPEAAWRARIGTARAQWARGEMDAALEGFRDAERLLDGEMLLVPLQEGRETFLAQRESATADHLELLLDLERQDEALALARRSRVRVLEQVHRAVRLSGLSAQEQAAWETFVAQFRAERAAIERLAGDDWQLALDRLDEARAERQSERERLMTQLDSVIALLEPVEVEASNRQASAESGLQTSPGELALVFHPLADGWVVFSQATERTTTHRPNCGDRTGVALASCLIAPVADEIRASSRLRLLVSGALREVDFQSVPFEGDVLLAAVPIVYDLDLRRPIADASEMPTSVLIVADPTGDLVQARHEADTVERLAGSLAVTRLSGRDADRDALTEALAGFDLLHFAGHASFEGRGGWDSYLPLANGGRLAVEDVLVLAKVPRWIVLSGCETGRAGERATVVEGLGLAHAFLTAGSESVIAAVRPVDDRLAAELSAAFYPPFLSGSSAAFALQEAQMVLREKYPEADWSSFRLIES